MEVLSKWIYTIIVAMMFATFVDILMPNSSLRKYTKLILGFLVMTIILQPLFGLVNKDISISSESFKYQAKIDSVYIKEQAEKYGNNQTSDITKLYKQNLEKQIGQFIIKEIGDREVSVQVEVVEDRSLEDYGTIISIYVALGKEAKEVDKIEKVEIGSSSKEDKKTVTKDNDGLKSKISAMYDINTDKIQINEKK